MNKMTLNSKDPAVMEAIKDCAVGDEKELLVKVKVTEVGPMVDFDVMSAKYAEEKVEEEEVVENNGEVVEEGMEAEAPMPMKKKKGNPALAILIAPGGKR
jgi:hypothetical protein